MRPVPQVRKGFVDKKALSTHINRVHPDAVSSRTCFS